MDTGDFRFLAQEHSVFDWSIIYSKTQFNKINQRGFPSFCFSKHLPQGCVGRQEDTPKHMIEHARKQPYDIDEDFGGLLLYFCNKESGFVRAFRFWGVGPDRIQRFGAYFVWTADRLSGTAATIFHRGF